MAQLYKIDYRRYGVQIPIPMADEIDRAAKDFSRSASQVIVEQLHRGMYGYGLCSNEEMDELRNDQMTLLKAMPLALTVLYGEAAKRGEAAGQLAEMIARATTRKPTELVAEPKAKPPGDYKVAPPPKPPDKTSRTPGARPRHRVSA